MKWIRRFFNALSFVVIWCLKPIKIYAYRTHSMLLRRLILEITTLIDFCLVFLNVQNETMLLHWKVYGGNFVFGKAIMVTDFEPADHAIRQPIMKNNNFMGINIVSSNPDAFATNSGILQQNQPVRAMTRKYIDENIFTQGIRELEAQAVRNDVQIIVDEWKQDPKMASMLSVRSTVIRIFFRVLNQTTVSNADAKFVARSYIRRFVELSLFSRYFPTMLGLLGTRGQIRKDAYFKLHQYGIDLMTIDMTLFAALFSVGTIVLRIIEDLQTFGIVYENLCDAEKVNLVLEAQRLYPTVTTVHRVLESAEEVNIAGSQFLLNAGDEIGYPFICSNRDPRHFTNPEAMDLRRPEVEFDKVLSWSKGPHECPGKELSIIVVILMLDSLSEKHRLSELKIFNPGF